MSTPAGITRVSGIGEYHGQKSFQRARFDPKTGKWDHDISSSMHHEASAGRGSNGCIRLLGNTGNELYNFIKKGDFIYTLPEKEGSRFVVREGSLNYIADNPYGEDSGEKRLWDDYNVHINKDFRPLNISVKIVIYLLISCLNGFITLMTQRMASILATLSLVLYQPLII